MKNRNGKPTAFQVAALKKAGLTLKGIKTYRDAENALKRVKRVAANKVKGQRSEVKQRTVKSSVAKKPVVKKTVSCKYSEAVKKADKADNLTVKAKTTDKKAICVKGKAPAAGKTVTVKGGVKDGCKNQKRIAGVGVFKVHVEPYDVIEALMVGFAKSVLAVLGRE